MAGSHERHERRCKRNHTHAAFIVSIAFSRRSHIGAWREVREREKRGEVERDRGRGGGTFALSPYPIPSLLFCSHLFAPSPQSELGASFIPTLGSNICVLVCVVLVHEKCTGKR